MKSSQVASFALPFLVAMLAPLGACTSAGPPSDSEMSSDEIAAAEASIRNRISRYLNELTVNRDAEAAGEYYTADARLLGPGMDSDRSGVVESIRAAFDAGMQVKVNRRTLELFVHGDVAYEVAQAEDIFIAPGGTADTLRNNLFIRWEKGVDDNWRFDRVVLGPQGVPDQ